jgi:hypothetical protein
MAEYQVWSIPNGKTKKRVAATFEEEEWQFALKFAKKLEDCGHKEVSVKEEETDE